MSSNDLERFFSWCKTERSFQIRERDGLDQSRSLEDVRYAGRLWDYFLSRRTRCTGLPSACGGQRHSYPTMKDSVVISIGAPYCPARGLLDKSASILFYRLGSDWNRTDSRLSVEPLFEVSSR